MAYDSSKLHLWIGGGIGSVLPSVWLYQTADAASVVRANGYISDGEAKGLKVSDFVFVQNTADYSTTVHIVNAVNANGSVDLTDGSVFAIATDTD